jgi:DNA-binding transcriptional MerR regulator
MSEDLYPSNPSPAPSGESPAASPAAGPSESPAPEQRPSEERVYRIGEVCRLTGTKAFVLRYWETEFPMLAPDKSPKGHRLYRREDVDMVFEIKQLLYEQGFTIAGARRLLESRGSAGAASQTSAVPQVVPSGSSVGRKLLVDLEGELRAILTLLESE